MPEATAAQAFARLHPDLQRWVWQRGWQSLRDIQVLAVEPILARTHDVVIAAPTASGKTEAALLPILSDLAQRREAGLGCLYVAPLRALINDQARRIESMCEASGLTFQPWHGDVTKGRARFWRHPTSVLLITPESLEAMLMRRGAMFAGILRSLRYLLVDELHAFIGTERGRQLQSLLHRVEQIVGGPLPRVALSATLGDFSIAQRFLRHDGSRPVIVLEPPKQPSDVRVAVKAVVPVPPTWADSEADGPAGASLDGLSTIAVDLFAQLRGASHLVFANSRNRVEALTDRLRAICERRNVPNEFFPHHGALSREVRLEAEERLREGKLPTTVIATSTLELGIDLGDVETIAQIGPPPGVAALRQRLGRSGRRPGTVPTLRQYVACAPVGRDSTPIDRLRIPLITALAILELAFEHKYEPPTESDLHLSTLMQQLVSRIYQFGGIRADEAFVELCERGPFQNVDRPLFIEFLRALGASKIIEQVADGTLMPGSIGERLAEHYDFYAAFATLEEWRLVAGGRPLGSVPTEFPMIEGALLVFAGRRWRITHVDAIARLVTLTPAGGGAPPEFGGNGPMVHSLVRRRMREILAGDQVAPYLDAAAQGQLQLARTEFRALGLHDTLFLVDGRDTWVAFFEGDRVLAAAVAGLARHQIEALALGPFLILTNRSMREADEALALLAQNLPKDPLDLADILPDAPAQKHDQWLTPDLRRRGSAMRDLDCHGLADSLRSFSARQADPRADHQPKD